MIRPASSTQIRWACRTVESRWATTSAVQLGGGDAQRALDRGLGLVVDGAGGLVEDEHGGVAQQRAGQGEPLALAAGEGDAALADPGVEAVGQRLDEVERGGRLGGRRGPRSRVASGRP